jgi:hypothetical protein
MSSKTLLDELITRLSKFPIWNETAPLGEPEAPVLVAERLTVDEGQNQSEMGGEPGQSGSALVEGKKSPFDPLSMKLVNEVPLKFVVKSPTWGSAPYTVTPEGMLLDCVPIPSTRLPFTEGDPPAGMLGSCTITPLLSCGRSATGFWTWLSRATVVPGQFDPLQE